ncbi:YjfB family protein [Paenibacillus sp. SYP-B4298]|uniref:YjfB family protein n=1 Tax=Paenibacillus sp. SYP-B4298 TaxID=2996034 RepID=UPI0022DDBAC1|nr:YjfB family protein [Paenibacillus sp. SYP-B4298]
MDIAALSSAMSQASLAQAVSMKVANLAKGQAVQQSNDLVKMMQQSAIPGVGGNIDIRI